MSAIAIMTDSNSGIMPSEGPDYGIHVLPMPVIIDGKTYFEELILHRKCSMKSRFRAL